MSGDDGYVPARWEFFDENDNVTDRFFLRCDRSLDLCDYERYSLFRDFPREDYHRIVVFAMPLSLAIRRSMEEIGRELDESVP